MTASSLPEDTTAQRLAQARWAMTTLEDRGCPARLAGGCVRDRLLGLSPKDFDIATTARPDQVVDLFTSLGKKVIPTGVDHGTVTLVGKFGQNEITTLRHDVKTDGRHAEVVFGASFEEDAARRDFTINAMFEDVHGKIYDFFGGLDDLKEKRLKFVGDPGQRIAEDYLRILRFFRFWARYELAPQPEALKAIEQLRAGLSRVSQERITQELLLTLGCPKIAEPLRGMRETKIWSLVIPEVSSFPTDAHLQTADQLNGLPGASLAIGRLAALLLAARRKPLSKLETRSLSDRLKLSRREGESLGFLTFLGFTQLAQLGPENADALDFVDAAESRTGERGFVTLCAPVLDAVLELTDFQAGSDKDLKVVIRHVSQIEAKFGHLRRSEMLIDGTMLMKELGLSSGKNLGALMRELKRQYRNGMWSTREEGMVCAKQIVQNHVQ